MKEKEVMWRIHTTLYILFSKCRQGATDWIRPSKTHMFNPYLPTHRMTLGGGAFRTWWGLDEAIIHERLWMGFTSFKESLTSLLPSSPCSPSCEDARRQQSVPQNSACWHPDLRPPASITMRNKFLLLKLPSLWYFVRAAPTD